MMTVLTGHEHVLRRVRSTVLVLTSPTDERILSFGIARTYVHILLGWYVTDDTPVSGSSSVVERKLPKLDVASSILVSRSIMYVVRTFWTLSVKN